jgi:uncharacterized protein
MSKKEKKYIKNNKTLVEESTQTSPGFTEIALYFLQKKILLRPKRLPQNFAFRFDIPFKEINIPFETEYNINLVKFFVESNESKGIVLYFHGNRDNVIRYAKHVPDFTRHQYEVWIPDYPEYGKSTGMFTEENVYRQAMILYNMALENTTKENIIVYGKSLGSGIASWLASEKDCRHLILETPYFSMTDLFSIHAPGFLGKKFYHFRFPTNEYLKKVSSPVTIFHGSHDRVIPYDNSVKLKDYLKPGDEFVTIKNASHNNVNDYTLYHKKLNEILLL